MLFHRKAADRAPGTTVAVLKMRAWPSGSKELVLDLECEVPDPALDFDEVLVGGDGTVDQYQRCRSSPYSSISLWRNRSSTVARPWSMMLSAPLRSTLSR
jgi:hypothetical protein